MKLTSREAEAARARRRAGEATLACEDIRLTADERDLFGQIEDQGLTHDERRRRIKDYFHRTSPVKSDAAE